MDATFTMSSTPRHLTIRGADLAGDDADSLMAILITLTQDGELALCDFPRTTGTKFGIRGDRVRAVRAAWRAAEAEHWRRVGTASFASSTWRRLPE